MTKTKRQDERGCHNLRLIAVRALEAMDEPGFMNKERVREALSAPDLTSRERGFIKSLVSTTIERKITIDWLINQVSVKRTGKMKPVILCILRISVCQLLFMDSVPARAAISEALKIVSIMKMDGLKGFVNGILRRLEREGEDLLKKANDPSIAFSMPEWIVGLLEKRFTHEETFSVLHSSLGARPLTIRTNISAISPAALKERLEKEGLKVLPGLHEYTFRISSERVENSLFQLPSFTEGLFSVQDESSVSVADFAGYDRGMRILDLCAAPGGKCCHAAEILSYKGKKGASLGRSNLNSPEIPENGMILARDRNRTKLGKIKENIDRLRLDNIETEIFDATAFDPSLEGAWDRVIADLPCSGLGDLGRKNDLKYRIKYEDIEELAKVQRMILNNAARYLKKGGRLIYSVCTITEEETTGQSEYIERELDLRKIEERLILPNERQDGFFIASFEKL